MIDSDRGSVNLAAHNGDADMTDTTHLVYLQARLASEKARLADATAKAEREARPVWVLSLIHI